LQSLQPIAVWPCKALHGGRIERQVRDEALHGGRIERQVCDKGTVSGTIAVNAARRVVISRSARSSHERRGDNTVALEAP
jgi:hypothetical protein